MPVGRWVLAVALVTILASAAALLSSCSTVTTSAEAPTIEGATFVGNKVCAECHTNISRIFPGAPHARVHVTSEKVGETSCESCHGPGSKHIAGGGGRGRFIVNPGKNPGPCFQCHLEVHGEFGLPQHHPVLEGRMNCVQCHDPHGLDIMKPSGGLAMSRVNQTCAQCHREQTKPFIFEHEALREGCTVCHNPHGSINAKLLVERDANLCLKCHAQVAAQGSDSVTGELFIGKVRHSSFVRTGTCWSAGCHTSVHGSNSNPKMIY